MFTMNLILGKPYFADIQYRTEVIDMPVRPAIIIYMMLYACLQPPRAESTADVDIETGFEEEFAEFTDVDRFIHRGGENQRVCAGT